MKLSRRNNYPSKCCVCTAHVPAQRGFVLAAGDVAVPVKGSAKWVTLCSRRACAELAAGKQAVAEAERLCIDADGTIYAPETDETRPLLYAIGQRHGKGWRASLNLRDRAHVIEIAERMGLSVHESLRTWADPEPVRVAVERARAAGLYPYQIEGVRWLAYRGTATGQHVASDDEREPVDRKRGGLFALDMGLGKTVQTLFSLHDDEALVVVAPANVLAVWRREAEKWRPDRFDNVHICKGVDSFRWPTSPRELVVTSYDVLPDAAPVIAKERERLLAERFGAPESATTKPAAKGKTKKTSASTKAKRKNDTPPLAVLSFKLADAYTTLLARERERPSTSTRHRIYLCLARWLEIADKIHRNRRALAHNARRRVVGPPPCPVLLVADEAHYVANNKAQRSTNWRALTNHARRIYALTGTPVEDKPLRLWGLLVSACCNPFTWSLFREQFSAYEGAWGGIDFAREMPEQGSTAPGAIIVKPGTAEILRRAMMRVRKSEVLRDLPPKVYSEIPVPLDDPKMRAKLDAIASEYASVLLSGELPPFEVMAPVRKLLADLTLSAVVEEVEKYEEMGEPVVVFSAHVAPVLALGEREGWTTITGDTSAERRGQIEDEFQRGEWRGIAGTSAMAAGLTLTRAATLLFVDRFWRLADNRQAEDRIHRISQDATSVHYVTFVPDHPLTWHVAALLAAKQRFVDATLHATTTVDKSKLARFDDGPDERQAQHDHDAAALSIAAQVAERRARARAEKLGESVLYKDAPTADVRDALRHMLSVCDGAEQRDSEGFNKPDAVVAGWLAPGVEAGCETATWSAGALLRRYPRQLAAKWPSLFRALSS